MSATYPNGGSLAWTEGRVTRRALVAGLAALVAVPAWGAPAADGLDRGDEVIDLWPGTPPGYTGAAPVLKVEQQANDAGRPDRWLTGIARPRLVVRRPARPNGAAVLLVPGGGYGFLSYDNEGSDQAAWLNALGVTAFILLYRLPGEGWSGRADVPLADAQRAMRVIRARAAGLGIAKDRVAVLGFSAGGHLAGSLATRHGERVYRAVDEADRESAAPALAALLYPVVTLDQSFVHAGSRDNLLGVGAPVAEARRRSVERNVDADTPPVFLAHAADDGLVPPANSIALFGAMQAARRPVELHLFEEGGHGFGARLTPDRPASAWPRLLTTFAKRHGAFAV